VSFRIAAGQAGFRWHPYGTKSLVIQPGFEWSDTYYPNNETLSTKEKRVFINIKHKFWQKWSQQLNYEDLRTAFDDNRLARDGNQNDLVGDPLRKRLHSLEYTLEFPFLYKTTLKLKQKGSVNRSNDAFNDFYDYHAYKIAGDLGRNLTQKLYAKASLSYEQKDYTQRTVTSLQVAQGDRENIQKVTLFYFLNEDWLLNSTWTRTEVDSNNVLYDYKKMTYLVGAYYSF